MNLTGLYIAIIEGKETYIKPGIADDIGDRMVGHSKGGNISTIHFLCISRPGFGRVVEALEDDGKVFFKKHFSKFNGVNRTEYIDPKLTGLTLKEVESYYRNQIENDPRFLIVKEKHLPLTLDSPNLKNFMENCVKYPEKYIEGF
jgi:hypothetical protein